MTLVHSPAAILELKKSEGREGLLAANSTWTRVRLGEVISVQNGAPFSSKLFNTRGDGVPLIRIRDVGKPSASTWYSGDFEEEYLVADGDILVGMDGDFRVSKWQGGRALLNQRVCRLIPDINRLDPNFLFFHLPAWLDVIWEFTSAVTVKHLSSRTIQDIPFPLPSLEDQKRIVAQLGDQLERLDATRTQLTQAETQLEQLRASTLNNYFGSGTQRVSWDMIPLGSLVLEQRKLVTPEPEVEYEVWAVTAYANGSPDVSYGREIKSSKQIVEPGDVLISKINPRINRVWQVTESHLPQIASTEWLSCRVLDATQVDSEYLVRFLQSPAFRNWIAASSSSVTGSHSRAKSREILKQMVPVPPLDEQRRIVAELEDQLGRLNATSTQLAQTENQFEQLRASVLHRVFSGGRDD